MAAHVRARRLLALTGKLWREYQGARAAWGATHPATVLAFANFRCFRRLLDRAGK